MSAAADHPRAARLLLSLLLPPELAAAEPDPPPADAAVWSTLQSIALRHRLLPVLRWRLRQRPEIPVPASLSAALEQHHRRGTLKALRRKQDLVCVFRGLQAVGIDAVAQKGAFLAFDVYPHPSLRPMRDLDILVPEARALEAFAALRQAGCTRDPQHPGDPRAHMGTQKHLPRLIAPGGSRVELHHRLSEWHNPLDPQMHRRSQTSADLAAAPGYWDRLVTRRFGGTPIRFPDPTDLLLHLCVHAAYDDRFSGGALILFDLDLLLRQATPDWPRFWQGARRGGWERGCALLLRLQAHLFQTPGMQWPSPDPSARVDAEFLNGLAPLLVSDMREGREGRLSKESEIPGSATATAGLAVQRIFAPRSKIATLYTVPADSWRAWLYYPRYWWWLVGRRVPQYLRARSNPSTIDDERTRAGVERWMRHEAP